MRGRHLLTLQDFSKEEILELLGTAHALKKTLKTDGATLTALQGKTMAMIFQKRSTRTRVSTETGMHKLGGHALFLGSDDIQV